MSWPVAAARVHGDEGSFIVGAAVVLAAFALLGGALLEVGQWYQHRRNLQVRTDAAALAGGTLFNECFANQPNANSDMETEAANYSGIPGQVTIGGKSATSSYNRAWEAGTPGNDGIGFQSNEYPTPGSATLPPRDAFGATSDECDTLDLDVKQTQDLPNLLSISPFSLVRGWARVELQTVLAEKPSLPLAIPNFDLSHVGVTFVDETTGNELTGCTGTVAGTTCTYELSNPTAATGVDGEPVTKWTLPPVSINLPTPGADGDLIGVRVSTGSSVGSCANTQGTNAYACVDITQTGSGIVGIRDYPASQTTTPALYEVWPSSCSPDTSPFFSDLDIGLGAQATCSVTLQAKVLNAAGCTTNPENLNPAATLIANMPANQSITMHVVPNSCDAHGWLWSGSTTLPIDSNSIQSEYPVALTYVRGGTKHTWTSAQRFTSGNLDDDGPVRMVSLSGAGNPYSATAGTDSVGVTVVTSEEGITHQLVVLRGAHNGSSTAFILCYDKGSGSPYSPEQGDPGVVDGMQNGCSFSYAINPTLTCPDAGGAQPLPADCIPNKTSAAGGNPLVSKPLNDRFGCSNNPPTYPDNWPNFSIPGDKRAVSLVLTSYNAYANGGKQNGSQTYPVAGFGNFYIAGFSGDNCAGDAPPPPQAAADGSNAGDIWGYFIEYSTGGAVPSGKKCKLNTFGSCVPALVR
jgi:putative Flp pilus-assembly TadE/G-like protein